MTGKEKLAYFEVTKCENETYDYLLVLLSTNPPTYGLKNHVYFSEDFNGKILLDNLLHVGNASDRFVEYHVESGKVLIDTKKVIHTDRKAALRQESNNILRKYENIVSHSILNNGQKKLLLAGISI